MPEELRAQNGGTPTQTIEPWFVYTVGILLLVVIAALTGLSLKLYHRARMAEASAAAMQSKTNQWQDALKILAQQQPKPLPSLDRTALATRPAMLDGQPVNVLQMDTRQARQLGLLPGDIVLVESEPSTTPASASSPPASQPASSQEGN